MDGKRHYREAQRLLICADSGGGNGSRQRAWKVHLQELSDETGMAITVCHYPPGTSKWDKIEHRLFSFISLNWIGRNDSAVRIAWRSVTYSPEAVWP